MKYNEKNKPLVCMMTQSTCYKGTRRFTPKGVLWHSTGANNPNLKRYVQPDDNAADRTEWLAKLGKNAYGNDWNHIERQAGLNFWIGKMADGKVAAVQTMPWDYRPWGCGSGSKGSCNDTHIQFEICEDSLTDASYFNACYQEACEMTAYLCKLFGIDPKGMISYNGLQVPTIIDHTGSHALGLGSNHGDVQHWSRRYGKTMENVRNDVAAILAADDAAPTPPSVSAETEDNAKAIWDRLYAAIQNPYGTAGVMGNFMAESSLRANNLQNSYEKSLGMKDEQYTAAVDNGSYTNFIQDKAGYGLYQATYWSIKESLLNYARANGKSIGDRDMQVDHFLKMMKEEYTAIWKVLTTAKTVREASDAVLLKFERPADQSEAVQVKRAGYGEEFLNKYGVMTPTAPAEEQAENEQLSATHAKYIHSTGTHYISNSGSDENGAYSGGQAGDQTGKEWRMRDWYSRPWTCVLRYPDQKVALKLAQLAIDAALNDHIGYDQSQNRTYLTQLKSVGWEPSRITANCEADCSAGVCANVTAAGYLLGIKVLQNHTGTYTGNMRSALTKAGFQLLTDSKYLTSGEYLLPGDILLNDGHHTATNVTFGKKAKSEWKPGATIGPVAPSEPAPVVTKYYRVRKSWAEKSSQIGAFTVFQNAKNCVDANPGYAAFDDNGNQVYPAVAQTIEPYLVKVSIDDLNYRKGPSTSYASWGYIPVGVYTIVDEQDGWGLLKAYADKRNGWISLAYAKRL
ncbi:MAG: N-acetylmuramoyl-L-alanine amidase [Oscillospiraceae bacterium]|nr:N-acetylmuramoyl-L-alanine amidase [Oscillospiraceae bacterium]MBR0392571.1 N-acetylmuramoyl-L-alanine amidase [Oscillospiraceae bacterium]